MRTLIRSLGCSVLLAAAAQAQERTALVHDTPQWRLHLVGTQEEARDLGAALAAALPQFERVVGEKLPRDQARQAPLRILEDRESWLASIRAEGEEPASSADYVYYSRSSDAVYVYRAATEPQTRALALHGAFQRFHCKVRPKNADLVRSWYVMGLANHLAVHQWDGKTIRLGALPIVGMDDLPALVLEHLGSEGFQGGQLFAEGLADAIVCFALVRHLMDHDPRVRARFEKLVLGHSGSKVSPDEYARRLGSPLEHARAVFEWFRDHQQPFTPLYGMWEDRGGGLLRSQPLRGPGALALSKAPLEELAVVLPPARAPEAFIGVAFGPEGTDRWIAGRRGGQLVVEEGKRGRIRYSSELAHGLGEVAVHLRFLDGSVRVTFDREVAGEWEVEGRRAGFLCTDGPAEFLRPQWR